MKVFGNLFAANLEPRAHRANSRVPMDFRVDIRCARDGARHSVLLKNLSVGGARVSTPLRLRKGDALSLTLAPEVGGKVEVACHVVAVRPRQGEMHVDYSLKFVAFTRGDADVIRRYVTGVQRMMAAAPPAFSSSRIR